MARKKKLPVNIDGLPISTASDGSIRGVIYARYSSHNQREESIEQQVEECTAFARANNITIMHVYADKAISGKTDRRTQFQRMMRDAEKQQFQVVVAYKSNRIARNMLNALQYEAKLDLFGIRTIYAKEEFGNTAAGRFALRTMMNVNQFYSENMAEDIRRGLADNAQNCKVNGALPLGYRKGVDGRYEIDEAEAEIVREIFNKVLKDVPFVDIADDLNARGIKTKKGTAWNKGSFHRMLTNTNYIGVYHYSDVVIEGGVPPIIGRSVFEAMQHKLKNKKNPQGRHRDTGDYLLTGKLKCGYCQSNMVGVSGRGKMGVLYYYYVCNKKRMESACHKENVRRDWIEQTVAEMTQEIILQDDVIEWIAENAVQYLREAKENSDLALMKVELESNQKAASNIMAAIEQGIITATTKERLLEVEANISELKNSIAAAEALIQPVDKERIIYSLTQLRDGDVTDKEYQRRLINTFVKAVYLWDDKIRIDYYYTGEKNSVELSFKDKPSGGETQDGVCTSSPSLHHRGARQTHDAVIYLTLDGFVLLCPLPHADH